MSGQATASLYNISEKDAPPITKKMASFRGRAKLVRRTEKAESAQLNSIKKNQPTNRLESHRRKELNLRKLQRKQQNSRRWSESLREGTQNSSKEKIKNIASQEDDVESA